MVQSFTGHDALVPEIKIRAGFLFALVQLLTIDPVAVSRIANL
jgi:hypothetical protein